VPLDDEPADLLIRQIETLASIQAEDRNDNEAGVSPSNQRDLLVVEADERTLAYAVCRAASRMSDAQRARGASCESVANQLCAAAHNRFAPS
jgi:Rod binding domain-containing protein